MVTTSSRSVLIVTGLVILLGIIHLAVGIGICTKYNKYSDVFRLSVGLSGYNIAVGLIGMIVGLLALFAVLTHRAAFAKKLAIGALVLAVFAIASFIAGLVINSRSIDYIKGRLTYRMASYTQDEDSITILDNVQSDFQCCGTNLWLDWSQISLGAPGVGGINTGTGTGVLGRRRRHMSVQAPASSTLLREAIRQKRQLISGGTDSNLYNLPTTFSFRLPLSCCKSGTTTSANNIGGYCLYSSNTSSTSFYVEGCLPPVANDCVSQVSGIIVINTCLGILSIVFFAVLLATPQEVDPNDPNGKQAQMNGMDAQQQMQQMQQQPMQYQDPNQMYNMNNNPMAYDYNNNQPTYYYGSNPPVYTTYQ